MSADRNKAVVRRMFDMFNRHDFEALEECVARTCVMHSTVLEDPQGGIGDLRRFFGMILGGFPNANITLHQVASEGEIVAVRFVFAGTHLGELKSNEPTGRQLSWEESMFFRFAGEKVEEIWHVINVMEVLEKLGALPSEKVRAWIAQVSRLFAKLGKLTRFGRR